MALVHVLWEDFMLTLTIWWIVRVIPRTRQTTGSFRVAVIRLGILTSGSSPDVPGSAASCFASFVTEPQMNKSCLDPSQCAQLLPDVTWWPWIGLIRMLHYLTLFWGQVYIRSLSMSISGAATWIYKGTRCTRKANMFFTFLTVSIY